MLDTLISIMPPEEGLGGYEFLKYYIVGIC